MVLGNVKVWFLLLCSGYLTAEELIVQTLDGQIKGHTEDTVTGNTFYLFQGIPFAQPPINELRFQAPKPVQPWEGVLDATYEKNKCFQLSGSYPDESEDCLFLNIFTPRDPSSNSSLPVMVWIYGGGFLNGWTEIASFGPDHFMDKDVILVTLNYRVGAFGFLSTGDSAIPGNAGLKDQNMALQWVNKNIEYFGGDPEKVTIFGESAGAASVAYQILSPKSKGLFRAAICQSGSALTPWAYQREQVRITYETAALIDPTLNNGNASSSDVLKALQSVTAQEIKDVSYSEASTMGIDQVQLQQGFVFAPVIEHDHEDAFISKMMYESLVAGDFNKVPLLIGMNSGEAEIMRDDSSINWVGPEFDRNHSLLNPHDMHIPDEETQQKVGEEIKNLYVPDGTLMGNISSLISYLNDQCFMRSIMRHAEIQSTMTDVFFYQFSYSGALGGHVEKPVEGFTDQVRHGEENGYLFSRVDLSYLVESDALVFNRFITMFTNFAKTLNPTPEKDELLENIIWPKVNPTYFPYLDIGSYSKVRLHPRSDTYSKWITLYDTYGQKPLDTY